MYTCLAIDDEFSSLEIINDYIALRPELKLLKSYNNASTALAEIESLKKQDDIIFLDIEMPTISGIELAKLIRHKTKNLFLPLLIRATLLILTNWKQMLFY